MKLIVGFFTLMGMVIAALLWAVYIVTSTAYPTLPQAFGVWSLVIGAFFLTILAIIFLEDVIEAFHRRLHK